MRHRRYRRFRILGMLLLTGVSAPASDARPLAARQVGRLTLHRCDTPAPWCGGLYRRLHPRGAVPRAISIYFEYYPHTAGGPPARTLGATQGGPGDPATGAPRAYLAPFWAPRPNPD